MTCAAWLNDAAGSALLVPNDYALLTSAYRGYATVAYREARDLLVAAWADEDVGYDLRELLWDDPELHTASDVEILDHALEMLRTNELVVLRVPRGITRDEAASACQPAEPPDGPSMGPWDPYRERREALLESCVDERGGATEYRVVGYADPDEIASLRWQCERELGVEVTVIDDGDIVGALANLVHVDAVDGVGNVRDVVEGVLADADGRPLRLVRIIGHADDGLQIMGDETISLNTMPQIRDELARWTPHLAPGAVVELHGCRVARTEAGRAFLRELSDIWGGIRVRAGVSYQRPMIPGYEGDWWECARGGCRLVESLEGDLVEATDELIDRVHGWPVSRPQ